MGPTSFDAVDPGLYSYEAQRWTRYGEGPPFRASTAAIVLGGLVLAILISADVQAALAQPTEVRITEVRWWVGTYLLGNSSGLTIGAGQQFPAQLVCTGLCLPFDRAGVNAPFTLLNSSFAFPWNEYVNLTIRAPSAAYSGPLNIDLQIGWNGPAGGTGPGK